MGSKLCVDSFSESFSGFAISISSTSILSPSSPTTAKGLPMGASSPSETRILRRIPSSKFSNSIVALSVSISANVSPFATWSPTLLCHLTTVPTDMVSLNLGISITIDMANQSMLRAARKTFSFPGN